MSRPRIRSVKPRRRCSTAMAPTPTSSSPASKPTWRRSTDIYRVNRMPTLFEKVWNSHVVAEEPGCPAVLYVDLHLVHEVTSPQAFTGLREKKLAVRRPDRTV